MRVASKISALALAVLSGCATGAFADPWKDESGHRRWSERYERRGNYPGWDDGFGASRRHRAFKEEYDDGFCKVERKWEKNGEYKKERKCRGGYPTYHR